MIIKEEFDIKYNSWSGYYEIVDDEGNRYGEYLTYEDAQSELESGLDYTGMPIIPEPEEEEDQYIVCRPYESRGKGYIMFSQGNISDHVSYGIHEVYDDFNDQSIKLYSEEDAKKEAQKYNNISKRKGLRRYQNWRAMKKWW